MEWYYIKHVSYDVQCQALIAFACRANHNNVRNLMPSACSAGLSSRLLQGALRLNAMHCFVAKKARETRLTFEVP